MFSILEKYKNISLHLMVVILGFTGILGKLISIDSSYLVWFRMLIAFVVLLIFLIFKKRLKKIKRENILPLIGVGAVVGLHWLFFFEAIKVANISIAVICLATSSLFSAFLEPLFFKRKVLKYEVIFGLIVLIVLSYMLYEKPEYQNNQTNYFLGYVYGIISAFLATLFTLLNAKFINKVDATEITMLEMLGGILVVTVLFICTADYTVFLKTISITDFIYLILLGTICTAGVFVWMIEIMRYITPYSLIMAVNLEPIYSIILALIIFGESELMSTAFYIGSSIIIAIVYLESYLKKTNNRIP